MAKYKPTLDIWTLDDEQRRALQPGQYVTAGPQGPKGRFYGEGRSTVVAWLDNARRSRDFAGYLRSLRDYARSVTRS